MTVEFELVSNPLLRGVLAVMGIPRDLSAVVRFYLKQTHPELELYATPLNMNPENPAMPISTPADYAAELADATGLFYSSSSSSSTCSSSSTVASSSTTSATSIRRHT